MKKLPFTEEFDAKIAAQIAARLRTARIQSDVIQRDASKKIGFSNISRIGQYERAERRASVGVILSAAEAYGADPKSIIFGDDDPEVNKLPKNHASIVQYIRTNASNIPPEAIDAIRLLLMSFKNEEKKTA